MSAHYLDSSAWVKHYVAESGTTVVDALLAGPGPHFASRLGVVELHAAFAKRVRVGQMTVSQFTTAVNGVRADLLAGTVLVVQLTRGRFGDAARLVTQHGLRHNLRSLDALQLAVALRLRLAQPGMTFVSGDQALLGLAANLGMPTLAV